MVIPMSEPLPRILVLVIALPVLTFLGSMAALYGGGLVAWLYGGISPDIYISRLTEAISLTHFKVGMLKAPFMGLVIGVVACAEGLKISIPIVIDNMDDKVEQAYAGWPDRIYIIGTDGKVVFRGRPGPAGFRPDEAEAALKELLRN